MFAEERQSKIVQMVEKGKSIKVIDLAVQFGVSESTIRRDLQEMEEAKLLKRTHGGAVGIQRKSFEPTFNEKKEEFLREKEAIGALAASLLEDGDSVILDTGTTTLEIAKRIKDLRLTVITNALDIAEELSDVGNIQLILTGGILRGNTRAMVGSLAEGTLKHFKADVAFIGANGISIEEGLTTPNHVEAMTKRAMMASATRVYGVVDTSKFEQVSFAVIASLKELTAVITSGELNEAQRKSYEDHDVVLMR